jgi:cell pole-organizing protein PopZ
MQRSPKATEPSMEEILASIRKIIAEDPTGAAPPQPAPSRMPAAPPVSARPGQPLLPASAQRPLPEGPPPHTAGERRKAADLDADLADLLGSIPPRSPGLPPAPPAPADGPADPKLGQRPQRQPGKANGAAGQMPAGAPALQQTHRPLSEALSRARAAERPSSADGAPALPAAPAQASQDADLARRGRVAPPPLAEPAPAPGGERSVERAIAQPAQPPSSGRGSESKRPSLEPTKVSEPAAELPAAGAAVDPRGRQAESDSSAAKPVSAKTGGQPVTAPDAVSAAAAAVARKVAATIPATAVPSRPFGASRAAAGAAGEATRTLEDTVAELLRPMLRQWLETNMPRIVEKALRVEIADSANPAKGPASGKEQS